MPGERRFKKCDVNRPLKVKMENHNLLHNIPRTPKVSLPVLVISKLVVLALPISEIAIGVVHLNDCPVQRYIPVYLVVTGVFSLALTLLSCLPCAQEPEEGEQNPLGRLCTCWNSLVSCFLFCWFITGNVWIYSIYQPTYDKTVPGGQYCDRTLYLFAFWITTLCYILVGVLLAGGCCMLLCLCLLGRRLPGGSYNEDV